MTRNGHSKLFKIARRRSAHSALPFMCARQVLESIPNTPCHKPERHTVQKAVMASHLQVFAEVSALGQWAAARARCAPGGRGRSYTRLQLCMW